MQLYTSQMDKRALCAFDDKRFMLEDGIHTLAYGHNEITAHVEELEEPEYTNDIVLSAEDAQHHRISAEDEEEFPEGQEPAAAGAEAQVLRLYTTLRTAPPAAPNPVVEGLLFFARHNRMPVQSAEGLSPNRVRALESVARYEARRNVPNEQIQGTTQALAAELREEDIKQEECVDYGDLAPIDRILNFLGAN